MRVGASPIAGPRPDVEREARCGGDCCRRFTLPWGPGQLRAAFTTWRDSNGRASTWFDPVAGVSVPMIADIGQIAPMLRWLGRSAVGVTGVRGDAVADWYTCSNLTPGGECGIYPDRPRMCRGYPYGRPCIYPGCASEAARCGR